MLLRPGMTAELSRRAIGATPRGRDVTTAPAAGLGADYHAPTLASTTAVGTSSTAAPVRASSAYVVDGTGAARPSVTPAGGSRRCPRPTVSRSFPGGRLVVAVGPGLRGRLDDSRRIRGDAATARDVAARRVRRRLHCPDGRLPRPRRTTRRRSPRHGSPLRRIACPSRGPSRRRRLSDPSR